LAILFPDVHFHLVDATGKKIKVVQAIAQSVGLKNVTAQHTRAETLEGAYDFIVSRAVAPLQTLYNWTRHLLSLKQINDIPNGWLVLKGGDLNIEIRDLKKKSLLTPVSDYFDEPYFQEKYIVYF
ncbi:MAG: class I SAM-dependent methyltransferase, partial [Chitinophagales bacterium]|nr:class I SAM-dependent methyltransferase [Chitinophagales bacterium]